MHSQKIVKVGRIKVRGQDLGEYVIIKCDVRPEWFYSEEDLLTQYEMMQRDSGEPGPIKDLNLRENPVLLITAKRLWSERLAARVKSST